MPFCARLLTPSSYSRSSTCLFLRSSSPLRFFSHLFLLSQRSCSAKNLPIFCLMPFIIFSSLVLFALFPNRSLSLITHKIQCPSALLLFHLLMPLTLLLPSPLDTVVCPLLLPTFSKDNCIYILTVPQLAVSYSGSPTVSYSSSLQPNSDF